MTARRRRAYLTLLLVAGALQVAGICAGDARLHVPGLALWAGAVWGWWRGS